MPKINIIMISHQPDSWLSQACSTYEKRLKPYWPINIIRLAPIKENNITAKKQQEAALLLTRLKADAYHIALDERATQHTTAELAEKMQVIIQNYRTLNFIVGGADGLDSQVINSAHDSWSLSRLTFPHQLVRLILTEQLYRIWSIIYHHPYHRA